MRRITKALILLIMFVSCKQSNNQIEDLMQSKNIESQIEGAYKAGESGKMKFIPYLLKDAYNPSRSTRLTF